MTLEDTLWDILDAVHLGEFFDKHNIPPIVFPIAVIAVIALIVFLLMGGFGGGAPSACGNNIKEGAEACDGSDVGMCTNGCTANCTCATTSPSKTIKVQVNGGLYCSNIHVVLKDQGGSSLGNSDMGQGARSKSFEGITAKSVYAEVSSSGSQRDPVKSDPIDTSSKSSIKISLDDEYCPSTPQPPGQKGNIRLSLTNARSPQEVTAEVTLFDGGGTPITSRIVTGSELFADLDANEYYYFAVIAAGFQEYDGSDDRVLVQPGEEVRKEITLQPHSDPVIINPELTGEVEICVSAEDGPVEGSGEVALYNAAGEMIKTGNLADCPLFRGRASGEGCMIFTVPRETVVYAAVRRAPSGCSVSERFGPITVGPEKEFIHIELSCNLIGKVKARVLGNNSAVKTGNCTVELYKIDKDDKEAKVATMNLSSDGIWTEEVELAAGTKVYVYAKNPPSGYLKAKSATKNVEAGKVLNITVQLSVPPPPLPNLTIYNAAASPGTLHPGDNLTVRATAVRVQGQTSDLTPAQGVQVTCATSWGATKAANYTSTDKWRCLNMTAPPDLGSKTVTMTATKANANQASQTLPVLVINESSEPLDIRLVNKVTYPSVTLYFNITKDDADGVAQPVNSGISKSIAVISFRAGNSYRYLLNTTLRRSTGNGMWKAEFKVPFKGNYSFLANASAVIGSTEYAGQLFGRFFVLKAAEGAIECLVDPQITSPNGGFNATAAFSLDGKPIGNQRMKVSVIGPYETRSTNMVWNGSLKKYTAEAYALDAECKYTVNCSAMDDSSVSDVDYIFAADPYAQGTSVVNCPYYETCTSLQQARDCYKLYTEDQSQEYYENAVECANGALESCGTGSSYVSDCSHAVKFKVRASGGTTNTTSYLTYFLPGSSSGVTTSLSYSTSKTGLKRPTVSSTSVTYKLVDVHLPGGNAEPDADFSEGTDFSTELASIAIDANGNVKATIFCNLYCGSGKGDLNADGKIDYLDEQIMQPVLDTLEIAGKPPYDPWPPSCLDANDDDYITEDDKDCLALLQTGIDCLTCSPSGGIEICNNYVDDNCDGQTDRETYSSTSKSFYSGTSQPYIEDLCACTANTPCAMLWSLYHEAAPQYEYNVKRCSSINGGSYAWQVSLDWQCNSGKTGLLKCANTPYACNIGTGNWTKQGCSVPPLSCVYPPNQLLTSTDQHWGCDYTLHACVPKTGLDKNYCRGSGDAAGTVDVCDGLDNDCDGSIDEGNPGGDVSCSLNPPHVFGGGGRPRYFGPCATGKTSCTNGVVVCNQAVWPVTEVCDGIDNDCDGTVDEGNPGAGSCFTTNLGICRPGHNVCSNGAITCVPNSAPTTETCNGLDDDCDGTVDEDVCGGGGGDDCLYVYSITSEGRFRDNVPYALSILPSWEAYTRGTMAHLKPEGGRLAIQLSEELPEINSVNKVDLSAVDHPAGTRVMPDRAGRLHTLSNLVGPASCMAEDGTDCLDELKAEDTNTYLFDIARLKGKSVPDLQDSLTLEFPKPAGATRAKIILKGSDAGLITYVWWKLLSEIGSEDMDSFLGILGGGSEGQIFGSFVDDKAKMAVEMWDGSQWIKVGSDYIAFYKDREGGETMFLTGLPKGGDTLKLRILLTVGTFYIDSLLVDYSDDLPVSETRLNMVSAETNGGADVSGKISADDANYLVLRKGEYADVVFADSPYGVQPGMERSYVVGAKGHFTFDVGDSGRLTPEKFLWIMRLFTDDQYLLSYALENYLPEKEDFFGMFFGDVTDPGF